MEACAFADSGRDSRSRRFYRVDRRFGIEGALDPRRETTSSQKNGWAANRATHGAERAVILPFTRVGPSASVQRGLISGILNYVFICVVAR